VVIFKKHPDVLQQYQRWFRYILVDEYQDTNVCQYLWLRLLAQAHKNICCVGDDDQSIYGWRGAEVGNILRFEKDFPGAVVVRLEQNYRSTPHILAAASGVIARTNGRLGKTLWTEEQQGEKVRLIGHWDGEEEARWIGEEIEGDPARPGPSRPADLDSMAILVRASHQMRAFEDRFLTIGLPYRVIGGPRFYERQEIRDAMAYFRLAVSPEDDLAFERVVNLPKRGLGDKAIQRSDQLARRRRCRCWMALGRPWQGVVIWRQGGNANCAAFVDGVDRWHVATHPPGIRPHPAGRNDSGRSGYTDVAERQDARGAGAAGEPQGTGQGAGAVRQPAGVLWNTSPDHGQRDRGGGGKGHHHDPARRQGAGVSGRLPAGLGGWPVPQPAQHGRKRAEGPRGGTPSGLCRHHPRRRAVHDFLCLATAGSMASGKASFPAASLMNFLPTMSRC
jgi:hypothetical protein